MLSITFWLGRISPIWQKWLANCCFCHDCPQTNGQSRTTTLCHQNFYFFSALHPPPRMHKARNYKVLEPWQHILIHVCKKWIGILPVSLSVSWNASVSVFYLALCTLVQPYQHKTTPHTYSHFSHISIWQSRGNVYVLSVFSFCYYNDVHWTTHRHVSGRTFQDCHQMRIRKSVALQRQENICCKHVDSLWLQ